MSRHLITQSLLSAWNYTFDCMEGYEEDAKSDFIRTLNRDKTEPSEAMLNGIAFENEVYKASHGSYRIAHPNWENGIQAVASRIIGAPNQVKVYKDFSVDGDDFLLFGILDALQAGHIYDVKFLNKSLGSTDVYGKYLTSAQHPAYLFALPEAVDFTYLLSDGDDLYTECYTREMTRYFPDIVSEFVSWLKSEKLYGLYCEKWEAYDRQT